MLEIIRQPPTQGPGHYRAINSNVNLKKPMWQQGLRGVFDEKKGAIYAFYIGSAIRFWGQAFALSLVS
ncbi:hypothetical protein ppKF707_1588 [Metapseudomonas furukawaii]|uniref:Uncharacterized protein n=1 Tax=Metapseudomonas furukawaii TaxID=1149133 RepID=A0AAD1C0I7_METFU|nr:hypothetical protein ppKF707_1588 [Pseudomonas furukawaii]BAU75091.1 hypothetical protein KF707C_34030 [Pseudomonas furukawaii]